MCAHNPVQFCSFPFTKLAGRPKKDSICNVPLPDLAQPMAPCDAPVAQRLFIVLAAVILIPINHKQFVKIPLNIY